MTIREVITILQNERQQNVPSRFHCRAIMVQNIQQYSELIGLLKNIPDTSVASLEDLFSSEDVMPDFSRLCSNEFENKWIILPGVSEYLRLYHISEESAQRFNQLWHYQYDAHSTGRILIPLLACESIWFDKSLHLNDDERQREHYYDCRNNDSDIQSMNIQILSYAYEKYVNRIKTKQMQVFYGLKAWYGYWYNPNIEDPNLLIVTNRYKSVKPTEGYIQIHVLKDLLSFINEKMHDGGQVNENNCSKETLEYLFEASLKGLSLDEAILQSLNINEINPIDIMSKWNMLSKAEKELVLLWYKLHPDSTYLSHCVGTAKSITGLPEQILMGVFAIQNNHIDWIDEARSIVDIIPIKRTEAFYNALDKVPSFEDRLKYLSAKDSRERIYILHLVGEWLRTDKEAVLQCPRLKEIYPTLLAYLSDNYDDDNLNLYFGKYKMHKLSNTLPSSEDMYFEGIDPEDYEFRYPVLSNENNNQTIILWIDAFGAEWVPLLKWALTTNNNNETNFTVQIVQANLPSETCFNEQWNQMNVPYKKYDKLDKLAHKGVIDDKDYYACVEEQLRFVYELVSTINTFLQTYQRVIITGDHGTSRLAARFFHVNAGKPIPNHASAGSHGRYCQTKEKPDHISTNQKVVQLSDTYYIIYSNYDHYTKSGFAAGANDDDPIYGEIHGGASPEEMLVPVFTINSTKELPIQASWNMKDNRTKISNKRVCCQIHFSKPVSVVSASIDSFEAESLSSNVPSQDWTLVFTGIKVDKTESFEVKVIADGKLVNTDTIEISPALGSEDPF